MNVSNLVGLREVPWETRNLNVPSFELDNDSVMAWKNRSLKNLLSDEIGDDYFVQVRVPANFPERISIVEDLGFRTAELAINPWIDLQKAKLYNAFLEKSTRFFPRDVDENNIRYETVEASKVSENTRREIIEASIESFSADRFHTDAQCLSSTADSRIGMWLEKDLLNNPLLRCTAVYLSDDLVGYMVWRKAEFILGGITPKYIGKGFAKLLYLQSMRRVHEGSNELSTTISANNIEVLNLYSRLEFSFRNPTYIFHLWGKVSKH